MKRTDVRLPHVQALDEALSYDQRRKEVRKALSAAAPPDCYAWLRDLGDGWCVAEVGDDLLRYTCTVDETTGAVTLGRPERVRVEYVSYPLPSAAGAVAEAAIEGEYVPLSEAAANGGAKLRIINPGWGSSGYYPAEVLRRDGPTVFPAGTKMYLNHPSRAEESDRPEREVEKLAATLTTAAAYDPNGPEGPGLYAEASISKAHAPMLAGIYKEIGVSIRCNGRVRQGEAEGRKGPIVEQLLPRELGASVDFVTEPGRGGKILDLWESHRKAGNDHILELGSGIKMESDKSTMEKESPHVDLTEAKAQIEALQKQNATLSDANKNLIETQNAITASVARLQETAALASARSIAEAALATERLHPATKARLIEAAVLAAPLTEARTLDVEPFKAKLAEAIKAEAAYLAEVGGVGSVAGMGPSAPSGTPAETRSALEESFKRAGLSPEAAAIAARGREV